VAYDLTHKSTEREAQKGKSKSRAERVGRRKGSEGAKMDVFVCFMMFEGEKYDRQYGNDEENRSGATKKVVTRLVV